MREFSIAMFLGGITVFIFGMSLLEEALRILAGRPFKKFLQQQTDHKFRAVVGGIVVTGILQGSSVVMLMILSFVGAGIMTLRNALAVMLGSNLGSTLNNWIVASVGFRLNLETFSYPLLAIALLCLLFKNQKMKALTNFLVGFALLFIGLEWMKSSVSVLVHHFDLSSYLNVHPYFFIIIGFLVTALIQSSSAMVAIALSALHSQAISFEMAACIVLGAELGTTLKLMIGSVGGSSDKKRLALGNFVFNLISLLLAAAFLWPLIDLVGFLIGGKEPLMIALVLFQTIVNIGGIILFYPFLGFFSKWLENRYRSDVDDQVVKYLKTAEQPFTEDALPLARLETMRLFRHALDYNRHLLGIDSKVEKTSWQGSSWRSLTRSLGVQSDPYRELKMLQGQILDYLANLDPKQMETGEAEYSASLLTISRDIVHAAKNIKDVAHNWNDINSSTNDSLHRLYLQTRLEEEKTFEDLERLLVENGGVVWQDRVEDLLQTNRARHKEIIDEIMILLKNERITELDASNLLNLFREIFSCHKALITSLGALHSLPARI